MSRETRAERYAAGMTLSEIARQDGVSRQAVHAFLKIQSASMRPRGRRAVNRETVAERYAAGQTCAEIAQQEGVLEITVRRILQRQGVTLRSSGPRRTAAWHDQAAAMRSQGMKLREIAAAFGVGTQAVWNAISRMEARS